MLYQTRSGRPATLARIREGGFTEWHIQLSGLPNHRPVLGIRDQNGRAYDNNRDLDIIPVVATPAETEATRQMFTALEGPDPIQSFILWLRRQRENKI